jgi:hypothetical protein
MIREFRNSYCPLSWSLKSLGNRMMFVVKVITIGGGLPIFLGASCPGSAFSAPVVCVPMSVVLKGVEKLPVNAPFGGSLTAANVGTGLVEFFAVCEISLKVCLLHLFISRKSSSWAVDSAEVYFITPFCPAFTPSFRAAFSLFSATLYMP